MELYTVVSLCIGIYGGTFSAINAFKTNFETVIKEASQNRGPFLDKVKEQNGEGTIHNTCVGKSSQIRHAERMWYWSNRIPAVLFAIVLFFLGFSAVRDWQMIDGRRSPPSQTNETNAPSLPPRSMVDYRDLSPWKYARFTVGLLLTANFLCILLAFGSWWFCKNAYNYLKTQHQGSVEALAKRFTRTDETASAPIILQKPAEQVAPKV